MWSFKDVYEEGLMKGAVQLHYGECRLECFLSLTRGEGQEMLASTTLLF